MASVFDVARYILGKTGPISAMKMQKLVYYCQAWSLVWDDPPDAPLFDERIEAWANGPVVPILFDAHRGCFKVDADFFQSGDDTSLSGVQKDTINRVVDFYGKKSAQWLSDLTHGEAPWREARSGIPDGVRGNAEITLESMSEYYGNL
ncbi:MAG TPA: type II toxin-antitoxin system antitoxin SocA domain-containing protein [Spirochaetia bacterium]|nr:type II toxin-antitoxin system antitoxin SocA domain-containing protein [Spirochaetia bacterium]